MEVLDRVSAKYWATYKIGSKSKPSEARKKKKKEKKGTKRRITASDNRRKRARVICRSLGGTPLENDYEPEICGILQLQSDFRFRFCIFCTILKGCYRNYNTLQK